MNNANLTIKRLTALIEMYSAADDDGETISGHGLSAISRFYMKTTIDANSGCWNWTGAKNSDGYSNFISGGKNFSGHRFITEYFSGKIPEDLVVHHKCENRRCVNPAHLKQVTQAENMRLSRRETCHRGHPMSGKNLYTNPKSGKRYCRACPRESKRRNRLALTPPRDNWNKVPQLAT